MSPKWTLYLVPGSHFDLGWCASVAETLQYGDEIIRMATQDISGEHPDYRFTVEYALFLKHLLDRRPDLLPQVKDLLRQRKLEVCAAWSGLMDQIYDGEATLRNIAMAKWWIRDVFGIDQDTVQLSDCPGHCRQIAQILARCGIRNMAYSRNGPTIPLHWWESPDGSKVLAANQWLGMHRSIKDYVGWATYGWGLILRESAEHIAQNLPGQIAKMGETWPLPPVLMSEETDMYPGDVKVLAAAETWNQDHGDLARIVPATISDFFAAVHEADTAALPTFGGESPYEFYAIPAFEALTYLEGRRAENMLATAEKFSAWTAILGLARYDTKAFDRAWERMTYSQDHNVGGRHGENNDLIRTRYVEEAFATGLNLSEEAVQAISLRVKYQDDLGVPITVFNPLSWQRDDVITTYLELFGEGQAIALCDGGGNEIPTQTTSVERQGDTEGPHSLTRVTFAFPACSLPPIGYATYYAKLTPQAPPAGDWFECSGETLSTAQFSLAAARQGLASLTWKGRELAGEGASPLSEPFGSVVVLEDTDMDVCETLTGQQWLADWESGFEVIEHGPVRATIRRRGEVGGAALRQEFTFYPALERLDLRLYVHWHGERNRQLRLALPFNVPGGQITYESPYCAVTMPKDEMDNTYRGTGGRFVQKWVDLSNDDFGVTLGMTNGCASLQEDGIYPVLLRTAWSCGTPFYWYDLVGDHTFRFRITPHEGTWRNPAAFRTGWELNAPCQLGRLNICRPMAPLAKEQTYREYESLCSIDSRTAMVTAIKQAQDGDGFVVRVVQMTGEAEETTLRFGYPLAAAWESNLVEDKGAEVKVDGQRLKVKLEPWGIQTWRVKVA